ncbi:unnamed protein product, partial [marine sediment metagenome]
RWTDGHGAIIRFPLDFYELIEFIGRISAMSTRRADGYDDSLDFPSPESLRGDPDAGSRE